MNIVLNGEPYSTTSVNLQELAQEQQLIGKRYAIELNQTLIPKHRHAQTAINEHDHIEIVLAVGGG